jgi:OOP family OmpA-OmpF porin
MRITTSITRIVPNRSAAAVLTALFLVSNPVSAEWYLGAAAGTSQADLECDFNISCVSDDEDSSAKIFGGIKAGPNVAVELAYRDLGEASARGTDSFFGAVDVAIETSVLSIATYGILPVGDVADLFGQIGLTYWDTEAKVNSSFFGSGSVDDTGIGFMIGLGGSVDLGKWLALRAEWEHFFDIGEDEDIEGFDIDMLSIGLLVRLP